MYNRRIWHDSVRDPARTYSVKQNSDGTQTLTPAGKVVQEGTNQSATNFNGIEDGIQDTNIATTILMQYFLHKDYEHGERITVLENDCTVESGEVTLTNSSKYPFNNSIKTIALSKVRKTTNYYVEYELLEYYGGLPGDIEISGKALNGFKIAFNGSAKTVKLKYQIKGGILS